MYRLAPSRCARRPKHPANRSRNCPSRVRRARAADTDSFTAGQCRKPPHKVQDRLHRAGAKRRAVALRSGEPLITKAGPDVAMKVRPRGRGGE